MYPRVSSFQAVLTAICAWGDLSYLIKMCTLLCHMFSTFFRKLFESTMSHSLLDVLYIVTRYFLGSKAEFFTSSQFLRLHKTLVLIDLFRTRLATATKEQLREEVVVLRWPGKTS